jgi:hypothetical protein
MTEFHRRGVEHEGRRGSRIDLQEGGCYLGIPQNPGHAVHEPVTINPVSTKSGAVHNHRAACTSRPNRARDACPLPAGSMLMVAYSPPAPVSTVAPPLPSSA